LVYGCLTGALATDAARGPDIVLILADDLAESKNQIAEQPEIARHMTELLRVLIARGRRSPGPTQKKDVPVYWQKSLKPASTGAK
jgi:hypothetical protein